MVIIRPQFVNLPPGGVPFPAQGLHHHRLHHQHNVLGAGVMGAQQSALGGVQRPLKQRAKDGRLNVAPVAGAGFPQFLQGGGVEGHGVPGLEQVAVEVGDGVGAGEAARGHLGEQAADGAVKAGRCAVILRHNAREQAVRQQAGVLGVQAEHQLIQVAGQPFRVGRRPGGSPLFHILHDGLEQRRRGAGDFVHGAQLLPEPARRKECIPQQLHPVGLLQAGHRNLVPGGLHILEVGLYAYRIKGRHHQQRRRFEMHLVTQQLVKSPFQLGIAALELPPEMFLKVGVGKPAGNGFLKGKNLGIPVSRRRRMPDQRAQVVEKRLRPLPFAEAGILPAGDELRRRERRWGRGHHQRSRHQRGGHQKSALRRSPNWRRPAYNTPNAQPTDA